MQKTSVRDLAADSGQDFPIAIASVPANARQRRNAFLGLMLMAVLGAIALPFANTRLPRVDSFVPVIQSVMCVADLLTAVLLFAQYSVQPQRALLALASGYVCSGLFAFLQTLAFPGAYSPVSPIGDGLNSASWLFVFWHSTFTLAVIVYTLSKDVGDSESRRLIGNVIGITVACVAVLIAGLTWVATTGAAYLPSMYEGPVRQAPFANYANIFLMALNVTALILLFVRRRTILDQWLIVTLLAWLPNFAVAVVFTVVRFTVAWYMSRVYALIAGSALLLVLLTEMVLLYSRLANAILLLRRERSDRLMTVAAATAAMAHEIRQPLTGIALQGSAALRWLKATPPDLQQAQARVESAVAGAHRVEEIISSVRELFRKTVHHRAIVDVNDAARQVIDLVQHDLRANQISVTAKYKNDLPHVHADRTLLELAILNLVKNAIDAMSSIQPDNRRLRLATDFNGSSGISVFIEDSGPGIAAKDRDRIFNSLYTTKHAGTGLGLSICRTIVDGHGGELRLTKTDSSGSVFEIALPVDSHDSASARVPNSGADGSSARPAG